MEVVLLLASDATKRFEYLSLNTKPRTAKYAALDCCFWFNRNRVVIE